MDLPLTTPALLFPAIAILMLGYINRYQGTASLIRAIKKDYDQGYLRIKIVQQIKILRKRIELLRYMLEIGALSLILACLAMFLIFEGLQTWSQVTFGASLLTMVISLCISLYETALSNKSLLIEVDDVINKEGK